MTTEEIISTYGTSHRREGWIAIYNLLKKRDDPFILETGCTRRLSTDGDGASTLFFGSIVHPTEYGSLISFDINSDHLLYAQSIIEDNIAKDHIWWQPIHGDSITNLTRFMTERPLDLIYLDSYDYTDPNKTLSQYHALAEFILASSVYSNDTIIAIDDTKLENNGKAGLLIPYLEYRNYICIFDQYQQIWRHKNACTH